MNRLPEHVQDRFHPLLPLSPESWPCMQSGRLDVIPLLVLIIWSPTGMEFLVIGLPCKWTRTQPAPGSQHSRWTPPLSLSLKSTTLKCVAMAVVGESGPKALNLPVLPTTPLRHRRIVNVCT